MNFEWNEQKNERNFRKHGIWFEEAQTTWTDPNACEFFDVGHNEDEDRFIRVGFSKNAELLLVIFCERNEDIVRIISARKATAKEQKQYEKGI